MFPVVFFFLKLFNIRYFILVEYKFFGSLFSFLKNFFLFILKAEQKKSVGSDLLMVHPAKPETAGKGPGGSQEPGAEAQTLSNHQLSLRMHKNRDQL